MFERGEGGGGRQRLLARGGGCPLGTLWGCHQNPLGLPLAPQPPPPAPQTPWGCSWYPLGLPLMPQDTPHPPRFPGTPGAARDPRGCTLGPPWDY